MGNITDDVTIMEVVNMERPDAETVINSYAGQSSNYHPVRLLGPNDLIGSETVGLSQDLSDLGQQPMARAEWWAR